MKVELVFLLFFSLSCFSIARSEEVSLFLSPEHIDKPFMTLEAGHPLLERLEAVPDQSQADAGWQWIEINGKYRGYVRSTDIGKALRVKDNATVYAKADSSSAVMTTILEDDQVELTELVDDWGSVVFEKKIPLYANQTKLFEESPEVEGNDQTVVSTDDDIGEGKEMVAPEDQMKVVVNESSAELSEVDSDSSVTVEVKEIATLEDYVVDSADVAPAPLVLEDLPDPASEVAIPAESIASSSKQNQTAEVGLPTGTPAESKISRDFYGVLKSHSGSLFRPSDYRYKLVDQYGKKIALIDFQKIVLSQSLSSYLNKPIRVRGTYIRPDERTGLVIIARNIYQMRK